MSVNRNVTVPAGKLLTSDVTASPPCDGPRVDHGGSPAPLSGPPVEGIE
jgi:hypothetical protein